MALADAAVGLNQASVDFVPDCGGTVAVIVQQFEVEEGSNEQVTIAQITIAEIPNYCAAGQNCQELIVTLGTIGDTVWLDFNGNGIQNVGETGDAGVTINLLDGSGNVIGTGYTTTTDGTGNYLFTGLLPGTYTVQFVAPSGKVFTLRNVGANDGIDSDANPVDGKTGIYTQALTPAVGDGPATVGSVPPPMRACSPRSASPASRSGTSIGTAPPAASTMPAISVWRACVSTSIPSITIHSITPM